MAAAGEPSFSAIIAQDQWLDKNLQITAVNFAQGDQRFVLGWHSLRSGISDIRISAALDVAELPMRTWPEHFDAYVAEDDVKTVKALLQDTEYKEVYEDDPDAHTEYDLWADYPNLNLNTLDNPSLSPNENKTLIISGEEALSLIEEGAFTLGGGDERKRYRRSAGICKEQYERLDIVLATTTGALVHP